MICFPKFWSPFAAIQRGSGSAAMKVMHVAQSLKGGPASYFDEVVPFQVERYGRNNVILVVPAEDLGFLTESTRMARVQTFPSRRRSAKSLLAFARSLHGAMSMEKPDIVHLHSTFAGAIGRVILPFGSMRPKVVYCAHGWAFDMAGGNVRGAVFTVVERVLSWRTDRIVNISNADQRSAIQHGIAADKNLMIHNGVGDVAPDGTSKREWQLKCGMDPDKINVLFVGRFDRQKGADIAFETMASLPPEAYALHAIGDAVVSGDNWAPMLAGKNVRHLGWLDRDAIMAFYSAADVVIMPSRWEGFGLVAAEAMRAGTPVLASGVGALPELVQDGVGGRVVRSGRKEDFATVLLETSRQEWVSMGVNARHHFLKHFTSDRLNADLEALYKDLTGLVGSPQMERA